MGGIAQALGPTAGVAIGAALTLACTLWILFIDPAMRGLAVEPSPAV